MAEGRGLRRHLPTLPLLCGVVLSAAAVALPGCFRNAALSAIRTQSLGDDPVYLGTHFTTIVYWYDPDAGTSFLLSEIPVEELLSGDPPPGQVLHIELLWEPKAGATPMDATATNASIRHVIITDHQVGVYGGAGFALPRGKPGGETWRLSVFDATTRLLESTDGFVDLLSPARLTGSFTARLDPETARKIDLAISQIVTNAMGETRFVQGERRSDEATERRRES